MKENTKKRDWVKNATIVFLVIMLILTFFSQTIMNYSLPQVAAQYSQSGSIATKIRGTGTVESGDPYQVMIKETRKVQSLAVKEGDEVKKGDVLIYLADQDSTELEAAKEALEEARDSYDLALLSAEIKSTDIYEAQTGLSTGSYRNQITTLQGDVDKLRAEVKNWQEKYDAFDIQKTITPENNADTNEEQKAYDKAKSAYEKADFAFREASQKNEAAKTRLAKEIAPLETELTAAKAALSTAQTAFDSDRARLVEARKELADITVSGGDAADIAALETEISALEKAIEEAPTKLEELSAVVSAVESEIKGLNDQLAETQNIQDEAEIAKNEAQITLAKAETALNNKKESGNTDATFDNLNRQQALVKVNLDVKKNELADKEAELTNLVSKINRVYNLGGLYEAVVKAQKEVNKLQEAVTGNTIVADISGTVISMNAISGKEVSPLEPVAVLQPEGQGYTMSFSVTNEQAKRVSVGDPADLVNSWRYDNVKLTLVSIKPDKANPSQNKMLTFKVEGDVMAGQSLSVSVGQKSANYDYIVPNSAIREDNNGKFILTVEMKSSPLGNRYIARREDVEVLASDDTQSAVRGNFSWAYVITTANKPVVAGQQVRLADN